MSLTGRPFNQCGFWFQCVQSQDKINACSWLRHRCLSVFISILVSIACKSSHAIRHQSSRFEMSGNAQMPSAVHVVLSLHTFHRLLLMCSSLIFAFAPCTPVRCFKYLMVSANTALAHHALYPAYAEEHIIVRQGQPLSFIVTIARSSSATAFLSRVSTRARSTLSLASAGYVLSN